MASNSCSVPSGMTAETEINTLIHGDRSNEKPRDHRTKPPLRLANRSGCYTNHAKSVSFKGLEIVEIQFTELWGLGG